MIGEQRRIAEIAPADVVGLFREVWSFVEGREQIKRKVFREFCSDRDCM